MCYTRRMRTQTYTSEKATLQLMSLVTNGVKHNARLAEIATALRTVIDSYGGLNRRERARLFNNAYNYTRRLKASGDGWTRVIASRTAYDSFMSVSRRVLASSDSRNKRIALGKAMTQFENDYGYEPVFYACSYHSNCSCGHDDYQGKIYVDRFWRTKVTPMDRDKILAYIRNRNIRTIQSVVKAPIWLTTRPYCRHYFVPVATADVLSSSPKKVLHQYNVYHYTPDYYDDNAYFRTRYEIYKHLNELVPCDDFNSMMRRSARSQN